MKPIDYFTLLYGVVKFGQPQFKERGILIEKMLDVLSTKLAHIDPKAIASLSSTISILDDHLVRPGLVETCQQLFVDNFGRLKSNKKLVIIMLMLIGKKGEFVPGIALQVFLGLQNLSEDLTLDDVETIMYYFNYCDESMRRHFHATIESKIRLGYSTRQNSFNAEQFSRLMMGVSHYNAFNKLSSEVMTAVLGIYNDGIKASQATQDSLEHHVRILEVLQKL